MKWTKQQAEYLLRVRDELAKGDLNEAYHWLYQIASPHFDKDSEEVWKVFENFSDETEAPIPTDITQWIKDEARKYGNNVLKNAIEMKITIPAAPITDFTNGANALYQLISQKLEEKEQEIQRLKGLIQTTFLSNYMENSMEDWFEFKTENNL